MDLGRTLKLNQHTKEPVKGLTARGEVTNDPLVNLFKVCLSVKDKEFTRCIDTEKDQHDKGLELTEDDPMNLAADKCKLLKQLGKCEAPDKNEEKPITLQAEIKSLKKRARNIKEGKTTKPATRNKEKPAWLAKHQKPDQAAMDCARRYVF